MTIIEKKKVFLAYLESVVGFGAKLPPLHNIVSHCFSLKGDYFDPEIQYLENIIEIYSFSTYFI